jgi:hypothetical protein
MLLILLLLIVLFCAVAGAPTGNWAMLAAAAITITMAAAMARLNSAGGRSELQAAQQLASRVLGSRRQIVFGAGLLSAGGAAYVAAVYGDPNPAAIVLWLLSIFLFLVSGVLHDRKSHLWRRLLTAAQFDRYDWLAMAMLLRTYRLDASLPAIHGDEGEMGMYARLALFGPGGERGESPLPYFRTAFLDHPTLFHFVQAAALALFGNTMYSLKLLSAIVGALCAPLIYVIGRIGWGRAAGLTAAWLLAVSHLHIQYSRIALNNIETVWFVIFFVVLLLLINVLGEIKRADTPAANSANILRNQTRSALHTISCHHRNHVHSDSKSYETHWDIPKQRLVGRCCPVCLHSLARSNCVSARSKSGGAFTRQGDLPDLRRRPLRPHPGNP